MKKKKVIIISLIITILILIGALVAAYFVLFKNNDFISTEELYKSVAEQVENFTYDEDTGLFYVNNEVVIIASTDASERDIKKIAGRYDGEISDAMDDIGVYCFTFDDEMDADEIDELCEELKEEELIDDAYLNPVIATQSDSIDDIPLAPVRKHVYPNDHWNNAEWNESVPRGDNWGVEAIHAPTAWAYLDELDEVNVGLIDSLPTTEHPDLDIDVYITSSDGASNYYSTEKVTVSAAKAGAHGCHVAGTIGARWENSNTGISGVIGNKGHMYYSTTVTFNETLSFPDSAKGTTTTFYSAYDYAKSIKELVNKDVRAINISRNTGRLECHAASHGNENAINYIQRQADVAERMLKRIIDDIEENGGNDFVLCVSAGNVNGITYYKDDSAPFGYVEDKKLRFWLKSEKGGTLAQYNNFLSLIDDPDIVNRLIVVGSVGIDQTNSTDTETRYTYSSFSCVGSRVDVVAPGENIYSLNTTGYESLSGTSMAAPHVTGVAALAFAANPALSGPEVKSLITTLTNGRYYYQGGFAGLVDAGKVTRAALATRETGYVHTVSNQVGLDLCFVVDTTGSMGDDIQNAKNNMTNILSTLSEKSSNYRVALVDYRDFSSRSGRSSDYPSKIQLNFSDNNEEITTAINSLTLGDGGDLPETVYSALHDALTLNWRPRSKKVIIVLGDAPPLDPEPNTGYTYDDVLLALYNADIGIDLDSSDSRVLGSPDSSAINVYTIGIESTDSFFESIAEDTGGKHTNISSASEVSDAIMESIENIELSYFESDVDFGDELSNETVDLYYDGEYAFSFPLNDNGKITLENVDPGEYEWEIKRLGKAGSIEIEDDEDVEISDDENKWYSFALVVWHRHRIALILITTGAIVLTVSSIIVVHVIKKKIKAKKSKASKHCPKCGNMLADGARFCAKCGHSAEVPSSINVQCIKCGNVLKPGSTFCSKCGTPVTKPSSTKKFCPKCGKEVNPAKLFCANCGSSIKTN